MVLFIGRRPFPQECGIAVHAVLRICPFSKEELAAAKRQIASTLHKLRETVKTLRGKENPERYKSQITLAERRIKAFEIAAILIDKEWKRP